MPFTVSPAAYKGGDYLFQGISNAANSIGGAINQYAQISDQATQSDALMNYLSQQNDPVSGKPIISPSALQDYQNHSLRQRAFVAGGTQAGMAALQALQHYGLAVQKQNVDNREAIARGNLYSAEAQKNMADASGTSTQPGITSVWDPVNNRYVAMAQKGKPVAGMEGTPGQYATDDKGTPYGKYNLQGKLERFQKPGLDLTGLFGGTGAAAGGSDPTAVDPGTNLPSSMLTQQPQTQAAPQGQAATAPQAQAGMVHVLHPDGKTDGYIPATNLAAAIQAGYKPL